MEFSELLSAQSGQPHGALWERGINVQGGEEGGREQSRLEDKVKALRREGHHRTKEPKTISYSLLWRMWGEK